MTVPRSDPLQQMPVVNAAGNLTPVLPVMIVQPGPGLSAVPITSVPLQLAGMQTVMPPQQGAVYANTSQISVPDFRNEVGKNLQLLDRLFCERSILWYAHVSFSFFPQLTFSDVCKPIFSKLFHMTWLYSKKKRCRFPKSAPNKNEERKKPKFRPSRV